jgi:hypothetical protein
MDLQDEDVLAIDKVNEPVLFADTPRPGTGQGMARRLRLSDAFKRVAHYLIEEPVNALHGAVVGG